VNPLRPSGGTRRIVLHDGFRFGVRRWGWRKRDADCFVTSLSALCRTKRADCTEGEHDVPLTTRKSALKYTGYGLNRNLTQACLHNPIKNSVNLAHWELS